MNKQNILPVIILSVAMIVSSLILAGGMKSLAVSVKAGSSHITAGFSNIRPANVPSNIKLSLGEVKLGNAGGGGQAFRVETIEK